MQNNFPTRVVLPNEITSKVLIREREIVCSILYLPQNVPSETPNLCYLPYEMNMARQSIIFVFQFICSKMKVN